MATMTRARLDAIILRGAALGLLLAVGPAAAAPTAPGAPIVLPAPRDLESAVAAIEQATGAKGEALEGAEGAIPLSEGRSFALAGTEVVRLLSGSHAIYRKAGLYLFRTERAFGMEGDKDRVGLLVAADRAAVIRRIGTAGPSRGVTSDRIVTWLEALEKDEPFDLLEVGTDYVAGRFLRAPKDPAALASRLAELAPDLVAGRRDKMMALLTEEIRANRTLYLFW